jgi:hypothetical protein
VYANILIDPTLHNEVGPAIVAFGQLFQAQSSVSSFLMKTFLKSFVKYQPHQDTTKVEGDTEKNLFGH